MMTMIRNMMETTAMTMMFHRLLSFLFSVMTSFREGLSFIGVTGVRSCDLLSCVEGPSFGDGSCCFSVGMGAVVVVVVVSVVVLDVVIALQGKRTFI